MPRGIVCPVSEPLLKQPRKLGTLVKSSARLGKVVDLYSYDMLETIDGPFVRYLFFSRYSGMVGTGTQALVLAEAVASK